MGRPMTDHARKAASTSGGAGVRMEHLDVAEVARWVDDCVAAVAAVMSHALTPPAARRCAAGIIRVLCGGLPAGAPSDDQDDCPRFVSALRKANLVRLRLQGASLH